MNVSVPIIQGGMGVGISLSGLASAVANMGGIGVISTVCIGLINISPGQNIRQANINALKKEIRRARTLTNGILGVNIMGVLTNYADMVKTSIEEGIDIIFSGAGLPLDLPKYLGKNIKTKLAPIISSGRAANILCSKWKQNFDYLPDAFVVEGPKAGGHLGFKADELEDGKNSLENLVQDVLKVTDDIKETYDHDIPVIAAGGIYTGKDMYLIMKHGATAVQLATRFVATYECDASPGFKDAFINAKERDVKIIKSPVGLPGRVIFNDFLQDVALEKKKPFECRHHCLKTCNPKTTLFCIAEALLEAQNGNLDNGFAFTGSNVDKIHKLSSVAEIFESLKEEYLTASKENSLE
jgi:nitronate monooxygenase